MFQEAEACYEAAIKQTAADAAAAASEIFAAQLRAILPPPALPRDADAGFGPAAELVASAQVVSAAAAPVTVAPWAAARVSPAAQGTAQVPPRPAETAELQIALDHLRNSLAAAPAGAAAAAAAREESQRADAERRRATGEAELRAQLLAQLNALPSSPASLAALPAHPAFPDAAHLRDVTYIGSAGGGGGGGSDGAAARAHAAASRFEHRTQCFQDSPMGF